MSPRRAYFQEYYARPEVWKRVLAYMREYRKRPKARAYKRAYDRTPQVREWRRDYQKKYRLRPEVRKRYLARMSANYAIRSGKLKRKPCEVCGRRRVQAHHDDYQQPLRVRWLCTTHHSEQH